MAEGISLAVRRVLDTEDIEGLFPLGAPMDEYQREAGLVAEAVQGLISHRRGAPISVDEVAEILQDVWCRSFGPFLAEDLAKRSAGLRRAATEILRVVRS